MADPNTPSRITENETIYILGLHNGVQRALGLSYITVIQIKTRGSRYRGTTIALDKGQGYTERLSENQSGVALAY
jgi:hypothetical protein